MQTYLSILEIMSSLARNANARFAWQTPAYVIRNNLSYKDKRGQG